MGKGRPTIRSKRARFVTLDEEEEDVCWIKEGEDARWKRDEGNDNESDGDEYVYLLAAVVFPSLEVCEALERPKGEGLLAEPCFFKDTVDLRLVASPDRDLRVLELPVASPSSSSLSPSSLLSLKLSMEPESFRFCAGLETKRLEKCKAVDAAVEEEDG